MTTKHHVSSLLVLTSALGLGGCTVESTPVAVPGASSLPAPAEGEGIQYSMTTRIASGDEVEHCQFVKAPAEGMWINSDLVRYDEGSHHFILFETNYDEIPTEKEDGSVVDTSGVFDCSDGPSNGWSISRVLGGAQDADGKPALTFPPNVGMYVRPGAVLMMNAHYINATPAAIEPEVRINLYTIPEEQAEHEGDLLFWYNIFVKVPSMGTSRAQMRCKIHEDITLMNAQSHMHARGVDFEAKIMGGDTIYTNTEWETVPVKSWDGGLQIPAGSVIDYACDFENNDPHTIYQGPRSTDEMCMFIGSYYPVNRATSMCSLESDPEATAFLGADWVGQGEADCFTTFGCAASADDDLEELTNCMLDAKPEVSSLAADALRCKFFNDDEGEDVFEACKTEFDACLEN